MLEGHKVQNLHADAKPLFPLPMSNYPTPAHMVAVNIPLCDFTEENGATEVWLGTHKEVRPLYWHGHENYKPLLAKWQDRAAIVQMTAPGVRWSSAICASITAACQTRRTNCDRCWRSSMPPRGCAYETRCPLPGERRISSNIQNSKPTVPFTILPCLPWTGATNAISKACPICARLLARAMEGYRYDPNQTHRYRNTSLGDGRRRSPVDSME